MRRAVVVRRDRDWRLRAQEFDDGTCLVADQLVARGVEARRSLLERVVPDEHRAKRRDSCIRRRTHEYLGDLAVILAQATGEIERFAPTQRARARQKDLLLHPDVPEEIVPESSVRPLVDRAVRSLARSEEPIDPGMILDQEPFDGPDRAAHLSRRTLQASNPGTHCRYARSKPPATRSKYCARRAAFALRRIFIEPPSPHLA